MSTPSCQNPHVICYFVGNGHLVRYLKASRIHLEQIHRERTRASVTNEPKVLSLMYKNFISRELGG